MFHSLETGIGYDVVLWFQTWRTDLVSLLFMPFNYLINEMTFLLVLPLVYWCFHKNAGKRLMQTVLFSFLVNVWFKAFFARPRPYQVTVPGKPAITPSLPALDSYGIPSGHTQGSVTIFGFAAREAANTAVTVLMIILIILTALSRLIHGVHYPQDVLAGAFLGVIIVFLYPVIYRSAKRFLHNLVLPAQGVLAVLLFFFLSFLYRTFVDDIKSFNSYISLAAVFSSGLFGFGLESRYVRFSTRGSIVKKMLRFMTGIILTLGIYIGLKLLFPLLNSGNNQNTALILRSVRYALLGIWVSAGAPAMFLRFRLAERE